MTSVHGELSPLQFYVIEFVGACFLKLLFFPSTNIWTATIEVKYCLKFVYSISPLIIFRFPGHFLFVFINKIMVPEIKWIKGGQKEPTPRMIYLKKNLSRICMQFFPLNSFLKILSGWISTDLLLLIPFQRFERIKSPILMD